jgi:hypothetical protein
VEKIGLALTAVMERQRGALYRPHLPVCSDKPNRVVVPGCRAEPSAWQEKDGDHA